MPRILLTTFFIIFTGNVFCQSEKVIYKEASDAFVNYLNNSDYNSIFEMFSDKMKNYLPVEKTKDYVLNTRKGLGQILRKDFIKYNNAAAVYKGFFENGLFSITISLDSLSKINGLLIIPYKDNNVPKIERNKTKLSLPFNGAWNITWGGDTKELNYHVESVSQKNAFDILILDSSGKSHKADGKINEDYYAFGKKIIAPCGGEIVLSVDGIKDNIPSEMNSFHVGGNTIILKTANSEYLVFCHFKNHSIKVKEGQKIKEGQLLGLCGNSGHSSEPHLHFHIQDAEDMNIATGIKCYFDKLIVNGKIKTDYSPIKGDIISSK